MKPERPRCTFGWWPGLFFCALFSLCSAREATEPVSRGEGVAVVYLPEDTNAVLHNPDMGWVLYENFPLDPDPHGSSTMLTLPEDDFPGVDSVALMFSWQDVETNQDTYDFSRVDRAYDYWHSRGKAIQLRMSAESLMFWENRTPPAGRGVPDYVLARMAPTEKQVRNLEGNPYTVVDARNAFYRERLAAFLAAVRKHFDQRRSVTLIDLRGFGVWGEWHSGFRYPSLAARREALKGVIDIWCAQLSGCPLALSYSYDPDSPKELYAGPNNKFAAEFTTNYSAFLEYSCFDYALTKTNITWRRDGCGGAVHSNERRLNDEAFNLHRAPMMGEFLGGYGAMKQGGSNWVTWVVEDALSLHPNYLNLIGWQSADARGFMRERPDLFKRGLLRMGYRLVPVRASFPTSVTGAASLGVDMQWVNRGTGRALRNYGIRISLLDEHGAGVATKEELLPTSDWVLGKTYVAHHTLPVSALHPGDYRLAFCLLDPATGRDIALPLTGGTSTNGVYAIGTVRKLDLSGSPRSMELPK